MLPVGKTAAGSRRPQVRGTAPRVLARRQRRRYKGGGRGREDAGRGPGWPCGCSGAAAPPAVPAAPRRGARPVVPRQRAGTERAPSGNGSLPQPASWMRPVPHGTSGRWLRHARFHCIKKNNQQANPSETMQNLNLIWNSWVSEKEAKPWVCRWFTPRKLCWKASPACPSAAFSTSLYSCRDRGQVICHCVRSHREAVALPGLGRFHTALWKRFVTNVSPNRPLLKAYV